MLTSCLNSDNDTQMTTYSDMAITNITLGTLNRYTLSTSSTTGNDTIIKSTYSGGSYPILIDQLSYRIYNKTDLPVGTDLKHVTLTVSTLNNGMVAVKSLTSDSLTWFSSNDSIDFSQTRIFRVYASNGATWRDYQVTLTASETEGIVFEWRKVVDDPSLSGWDNMYMEVFKDTVCISESPVVVKGNTAYALENGQLMRSDIIGEWSPVEGAPLLSNIFACGYKELFAIGTDGMVKHSFDEGLTWSDDVLDTDLALFPKEGLVSVNWDYANSDSTDYVLVAGKHPQSPSYMAIWRKISQFEGVGKGGKWVYMPLDELNPYQLPNNGVLSLAYYNNKVLAMNDGMVLLESRDQGITWKNSTDYAVPSNMTGTRVRMAATDKTGIWMLTNSGQLWHGIKR